MSLLFSPFVFRNSKRIIIINIWLNIREKIVADLGDVRPRPATTTSGNDLGIPPIFMQPILFLTTLCRRESLSKGNLHNLLPRKAIFLLAKLPAPQNLSCGVVGNHHSILLDGLSCLHLHFHGKSPT
ncbi:hypothetical protein ACOSQ3_011693 [Xanthoceras sorbifolium]